MALIAIIDDSKLSRTFGAASLKQAGHEVVEFEPSGLDAVVARLREVKPTLMVLDQQMPAFLGSSLVRVCFEDEALATIKVLMLTAHRDAELEQRMAKLGVRGFLHKPAGPAELNKAVAALLEQ